MAPTSCTWRIPLSRSSSEANVASLVSSWSSRFIIPSSSDSRISISLHLSARSSSACCNVCKPCSTSSKRALSSITSFWHSTSPLPAVDLIDNSVIMPRSAAETAGVCGPGLNMSELPLLETPSRKWTRVSELASNRCIVRMSMVSSDMRALINSAQSMLPVLSPSRSLKAYFDMSCNSSESILPACICSWKISCRCQQSIACVMPSIEATGFFQLPSIMARKPISASITLASEF
mmetsp:Transcript_80877/g.160293  ORF Transcript_80877/g.160293 Transcript_80877/m.160293 type:complete len:235 (-) Transcript_80877:1334-2038(-)